jgi:hypothetical protein
MQKLVTIYLDNSGYKAGKMLVGSYGDLHGQIEEHLRDLLKDGWAIQSVAGFGGSADGITVRGWFAVVLSK